MKSSDEKDCDQFEIFKMAQGGKCFKWSTRGKGKACVLVIMPLAQVRDLHRGVGSSWVKYGSEMMSLGFGR